MRTYHLTLIGFGHVGRSLAQLLLRKSDELRDRYGIAWRLTGVATRRLGWLVAPDGFDVERLLAGDTAQAVTPRPPGIWKWLAASQADVLFEASSLSPATGQPAIEHVRAALEAGAHAITANKGCTIHAYRELTELAAARGRRFLFEATVMGGAPVFSLFRETRPALRLLRFRGLLNSTTSVILQEIAAGADLDAAVRRAQALGVAETDPSHDVDGWDAAVKLAALATVLMDAPLALDRIERAGIRHLDPAAVQSAAAEGRPYRLVARLERGVDGTVAGAVGPERLAAGDPLAGHTGTTNVAHFETDVLPGLTLVSHQGDATTTAYDMLADFIAAVRP